MTPNLHLWLIPALCFAGFAANILFGRVWSRAMAGAISVGVVAAAFAQALWVASRVAGGLALPYLEFHRPWIDTAGLTVPFGFQLDQLSLVMLLIVTGVGLLIHIYSLGYMAEEGGFYRFFALLNVFMFFMLTLVLANNYALTFVGWEGVGFASYMLIGFYFNRDTAARAGMKAFVTNRIGDFGFIIGLFLIYLHFGTFNYTQVFAAVRTMPVEATWTGTLTLIALLIFVGATGKSAQLPLYVWLPDAMEGPTPVSALIHAATMVTAGVYIVCRSAAIFDRAPYAQAVVLAIGALTAIFAASIGLLQRDIKRILAYSTVSQLGYMFMACGAAAYGAGIFHLMTHAFFKGLLFLGAGSVIHAMHGEQDIWKIRAGAPGGLRKYAPVTFWTFLVATCAISGIPGFSGFFSKDKILYEVLTSGRGNAGWWAVGTIAALLTSFYMFRALFVTFFEGPQGATSGDEHHAHEPGQEHGHDAHHAPHESPGVMTLPLGILAILAAIGGYVGLGDRFEHFLDPVFASGVTLPAPHEIPGGEMTVTAISVAVGLIGLLIAWSFYLKNPATPRRLADRFSGLYRLIFNKYWVDELYGALITRPLAWLSWAFLYRVVDAGLVDGSVNGVAEVAQASGDGLRRQVSGNLRSYAAWLAAGAALVLLYMLSGIGVR